MTSNASPNRDFALAAIFTDHMVLQRDVPIDIWGYGPAGESVSIQWSGQATDATIDRDGKWRARIGPMKTGARAEISAMCGDRTIALEDVLIGDVWLCSGQSNMQWTVGTVENAEVELKTAERHSDIRLFVVPKAGIDKPVEDLNASWQRCTPETVKDFSAVGYFFARELALNSAPLSDVPIGLIDSSFGGTLAEAWIRPSALNDRHGDENLRESMFGFPPSAMYNAMIHPVVPFALRGVLWYQGESNSGRPAQYERLLTTLIQDWRELWQNSELPFLVVQLPNFAERFDGKHYTWLREAQWKVADKLDRVEIVVSIDTSDGYDLHPRQKQEIGRRLGLVARNAVYGEEIICHGPRMRSVDFERKNAIISFEEDTGNLVGRTYDGQLRGFQLAGADGRFHFATGVIENGNVRVSHPSVDKPEFVRYLWEGNPEVDLCNDVGLPAAPFRTDNFEIEAIEVAAAPQAFFVQTPHYSARVDGDSCWTSLRVEEREFLETTMPLARGAFFETIWGPARTYKLTRLGPDRLSVEGEVGDLEYHFRADRIDIEATNRKAEAIRYRLVFRRQVVLAEGRRIENFDDGDTSNWICTLDGTDLFVIGEGFSKELYQNTHPSLAHELGPGERLSFSIFVGSQEENIDQ